MLLTATEMSCSKEQESRSVEPLAPARLMNTTAAAPAFSREASTGVFVGVRKFPHDLTLDVPYAVDDAVDLAYRFALDQRVGLIPPRSVVLAISGTPQKRESSDRLHELERAGARVVKDVSSGDILQLVEEQAIRAGDDGLFVLSIASHGFQQNGDAYILGSTSDFAAPKTAVRLATLVDSAARAKRSVLFIDACRDRIGQGSRSGPDPAATAPLLGGMKRAQGQVIFFAAAAGQYAFDDHVHRNGVFTKAVLDGLDCEASAPRGMVIVETLHTFVDRAVRRWIRDNKHRTVNPATQISMEGETRNMPLCECWRTPGPAIRVVANGAKLTAYGEDTRPLWQKAFPSPIVLAEAADLDGDAFYEVVVGLGDRIVVFDRDGKPRWTRNGDAETLRSFTIGDLFEKHTGQILALWNDAHGSRLAVIDGDGSERSTFRWAGTLLRVAVGRPTNMHAPKIIVAADNMLLLLHPRKLERGTPIWRRVFRPPTAKDAIRDLQVVDGNGDTRRDIAVTTASGTSWFTFDGKVMGRRRRK